MAQQSGSFDQDARAVQFLQDQRDIAVQTDSALLVAGDTNSFTSPDLDCWGVRAKIRPSSLAMQMDKMGLSDCFRELHPRLRAYTFYSRQGTVSRLDQIWFMDGVGGASQVINAAIVWQWQRRTDHDPVVVDFRHSLPSAPAASADPARTDWRRIVDAGLSDSGADLRAKIRANIDPSRPALAAVMSVARQAADTFLDTLTVTLLEPGGLADQRNGNLRDALEKATSLSVVASLPPPSPKPDFALSRAKASWEECIHQLRSLKTLLLHAADGPASQLQISEQHGVVRRCGREAHNIL